ncbi:MAG: putative SOS response-associated peptidase YedK [Candidatus Azotimanducaceae bacterium]|jgi:putative SOS response-associated peptidase YedK
MEITGQSGPWSMTTEYNIAPTQQIPVLRYADGNEWNLSLMRWWLVPSWSPGPSTKYSMFNAKAETLSTSRAYREPYQSRRCIVPISGYYEWRSSGTQKLPYYIEPAVAPGFALAGLWERWQGVAQGEQQVIESCTIVTTAATQAMSSVHHRMPVHFTDEQARQWVGAQANADELQALLAPELRTGIRVTPVSTVVNNARNKDERCLEPLGHARIIHQRPKID